VVEAPRLELVDGHLRLGAPRVETVAAWRDPDGPLGGVAPGDTVSLHWGWACDRLTAAQLRALVGWTNIAVGIADRSI
jgi:hypothetical protein